MKKQWEVRTRRVDGRTKLHPCHNVETGARHVYDALVEDCQGVGEQIEVLLLCDGELVEMYPDPRPTVAEQDTTHYIW